MLVIKKFFLSLFLSILISSPLFCIVIEHNDMAHAFSYVDKETLVVFDLDNTLIETTQYLGSDQWFTYKVAEYISQGRTQMEAESILVPLWIDIQKKTHMRPVDPEIPALLSAMQKKHVPMIALTKRSPLLAERTLEQLAPLNIDFVHTSHIKKTLQFPQLNHSMLSKGILFCGFEVDKGALLVEFMKELDKMPRRVVFIDDKMHHVLNVEKALAKLNIDFVGIRYGKADERFKDMDKRIADLQLDHFHKILSDEQATHLLKMQN